MVQERIANCNDAQNVDVLVPQILEASVQTIQLQHVESDFLKMDQIVAQARISVDEPVLECVQTIAQELISMSNVDDQSVDDTQSLSLFVSRIEEGIGKIIQQVPLTAEEIREAFSAGASGVQPRVPPTKRVPVQEKGLVQSQNCQINLDGNKNMGADSCEVCRIRPLWLPCHVRFFERRWSFGV